MKLTDFDLLTDENIHPEIVEYLRSLGFDVKDVKEELLQGTSDEKLLEIAFQNE